MTLTFDSVNNLVKQSQVDANFSTLPSGIPRISVGTGNNKITTYNFGTNKFEINGRLTIDPKRENIMFSIDNAIRVNGGSFKILGNVSNSVFSAISSTGVANPFWDFGLLKVESNGEFFWKNAGIVSSGGFFFELGSKVEIENAQFYSNDSEVVAGRGNISIIKSSDFKMTNFRMIGGELLFNANFSHPILSLERINAKIGVSNWSSTPLSLIDTKIGGNGNDIDISIYNGKVIKIFNEKVGTDLKIIGAENQVDSRNSGRVEIYRNVQFEALDESGNPIKDVAFFITDTDNGARKNLNGVDDRPSKNYFYKTKVTGKTDKFPVLLSVVSVAGTNGRGTPNSGVYTVDVHGENNILGEDKFGYHAWGYNLKHESNKMYLPGNGTLNISEHFSEDHKISESDVSKTNSYTEIDTPQKFYDIAKKYLTTSHHVSHQAGGSHDLLVDRIENKIILHEKNLVIDKNAANLFSYDAHEGKITIKATIFKGDLELEKGNLTFLNGGKHVGLYSGANSVSLLLKNTERTIISIYDEDAKMNMTAPIEISSNFSVLVSKGKKIRITAKNIKSKPFSKTFTMNFGEIFDLGKIPHEHFIDTSLDISQWLPKVSLPFGNETILFKADVLLRGKIEESKTIFNKIMTTIESVSHFEKLGKNNIVPYEIQPNKIIWKRLNFQMDREPGISSSTKTEFGCPIFFLDETTKYVSNPDVNGKRVEIDPEITLTGISTVDIENIGNDVVSKLEKSGGVLDIMKIKSAVLPTKTELNQRTIPSANYFNSSTDAVKVSSVGNSNISSIKDFTKNVDVGSFDGKKIMEDSRIFAADFSDKIIYEIINQIQLNPISSTLPGGIEGITLDPLGKYIYSAIYQSHSIYRTNIESKVSTLIIGKDGVSGDINGSSGINSRIKLPSAVWIHPEGHFGVFSDYGNNKLKRFSIPDFKVTTIVGSAQGDADGVGTVKARINNPGDMAYYDGNLYFIDVGNKKVKYYDFRTKYVSTMSLGGEILLNPEGITISEDGKMVISDTKNRNSKLVLWNLKTNDYFKIPSFDENRINSETQFIKFSNSDKKLYWSSNGSRVYTLNMETGFETTSNAQFSYSTGIATYSVMKNPMKTEVIIDNSEISGMKRKIDGLHNFDPSSNSVIVRKIGSDDVSGKADLKTDISGIETKIDNVQKEFGYSEKLEGDQKVVYDKITGLEVRRFGLTEGQEDDTSAGINTPVKKSELV